ncbi:MAG: hypothetical protein ACTHMC_24090 [Pseudobacter sp.]|uniref:hypothetical protein n=1 Tax=Pseudobacter sp. TaxID=2045420 RepID=UPI003F7D49BB
MKKWKSVAALLLAVSTIVSCSKSSVEKAGDRAVENNASNSLVRQSSTRIKAMISSSDTIRFYYNREGGLDSVIGKYDRYIVYGKGKYADSMAHYFKSDFGQYLENLYTKIKYNEEGRMIEYTMTHPRFPGWPPARYILHYNQSGDLTEQRMQVENNQKKENFYRYNEDNDLVWNNTVIDGAGDHICTLRSDGQLNPFYKMDLMYIIFGYNEKQQMLLSKHNLVEVYREYEGRLITFLNEYDEDGRLIKKTDLRYNDYFTLSYY